MQGERGGHDTDGAPRNRASTLASAILRISTGFEFDTVLREIVDGARGLTGAGLGIIATVDGAGVPGEYAFRGFAPGEERELVAWSGGLRFVEHLHELAGPLRVEDLRPYVRGLGLTPPSIFPGAFLGTPVRYRGAGVGYLFLGGTADGEAFTGADEEVLVLFAAQAAVAIANVRARRRERRTRMDLEALVETSPAGVVVFDGRSGRMVSSNREARRIVEGLRTPGRPLEELLAVAVCRRADGREVSLAELPLAEQSAANPGTVRSEEVVLSVPDGRSVRMLVSVTPIGTGGPAAGSVVVTMQDLAPIEEIERMRTEFLGLVSHELLSPLAAIKGAAVTLHGSAGLDPAEMREYFRIILEQADHMQGLMADLLDAGRIDSRTLSVSPEPASVAELVEQARRTFLAGDPGRGVAVDLADDLPPVLADRRRVVQVLNNLLANASRTTAASAVVRVAAVREGHDVAVSVADDGAGVAAELLPHLFRKHAGGGSGTAGHGLGLAICKGLVEAHGGRIRAASEGPGRGTTITFTVPAAEPGGQDAASAGAEPRRPQGSRILVLDDDPNTLRSVREMLTAAGYAPVVTGAPDELPGLVRSERPDLVLLDLLLPGRDGLELLRDVPELSDQPVIFISGYGREETVARALEEGAEDYIVKPFSPAELVARIGVALRRHREPEAFVLRGLEIRHERRMVTVRGRAVDLTATEYALLRELSANAGRVVDYGTLLRRVWPGRPGGEANLVQLFVRSLRRKLGDSAGSPTWIFNHRGVGYRMPSPGES